MDTISARVEELSTRIFMRRVTSASEREQVFRLRHACYLEEGAIDPLPGGMLCDQFDRAGSSDIIGLYESGELIGSIRLQVLSREHPGSPSALAFPEVIAPLLAAGKRLLDPTRFVIATEASRRFPGLAYFALRLPFMAAAYYGVDIALAAVRSEHMPFYRRTLRYRQVSATRDYLLLNKPLGLMLADYRQERQLVLDRFPCFFADAAEAESLFGTERVDAASAG